MLRLAEDHCAPEKGAPSRGVQSTLDLYSRLRRLQSGAHAKSGRRSSGGISRGRSVSRPSLISALEAEKYRQSRSSTPSTTKQKDKTCCESIFQQPARLLDWQTGRLLIFSLRVRGELLLDDNSEWRFFTSIIK